jgi:hypothetical protein
MFSLLAAKQEIEVSVKADEQAAKSLADEIVGQASEEKKEYSYTVTSTGISVRMGHRGLSYDVQKLVQMITERYMAQDYSVLEYPGTIDEPEPLDLQGLYDQTFVKPKDAELSVKDGENTVLDILSA